MLPWNSRPLSVCVSDLQEIACQSMGEEAEQGKGAVHVAGQKAYNPASKPADMDWGSAAFAPREMEVRKTFSVAICGGPGIGRQMPRSLKGDPDRTADAI